MGCASAFDKLRRTLSPTKRPKRPRSRQGDKSSLPAHWFCSLMGLPRVFHLRFETRQVGFVPKMLEGQLVHSIAFAGWHHLAVVGDFGGTSVHIDYEDAGRCPVSLADPIAAIGNGSRGPEYQFECPFGRVWNVVVFNRALSPYEIGRLKN